MPLQKIIFMALFLTITTGFGVYAQSPFAGKHVPSTGAHRLSAVRPPAVNGVASPPGATNLAYPQSLFVDSRNGNIWIADFDNHRIVRFDVSSLTGVGESPPSLTAEDYTLGQNYPNPFNPATTITFALRNTGPATVKVYDLLGREVATLFDAVATARTPYSLSFDATNLPSGMYFYTLRSEGRSEVRKMGVVK